MARCAGLLRGVNVGGVTMKSAQLADTAREAGFTQVKTVLASGNVVFDTSLSVADATLALEAALADAFGYEARAHVLTVDTLREVVEAYPFPARDGWHRYVNFRLAGAPRIPLPDDLDPAMERVADGEGVVYWTVLRGRTLDSPFAKLMARGPHRGTTTSRNLNTLEKLLR